jgi:hypothetical protein
MKPQHVYEIDRIDEDGNRVQHKTGISGRKLNKNGDSPRANQQVRKLNNATGVDGEKVRYEARVVAKDLPGRLAAVTTEQHFVNIQKNEQGKVGKGQDLPLPNNMLGPLAR